MVERSPQAVSDHRLLSDSRFEYYVMEKLVMAQFLAHQCRQANTLIDGAPGAPEQVADGGQRRAARTR